MKNNKNLTNKEEKVKRQGELRCSISPPNKGENAKRKPKHGAKTPKHKTDKTVI